MDGATSPFEGESIPRAFRMGSVDATPPRLAASPDVDPHPACTVRPPCWPISRRHRPTSQHRRAAVEQGREAASCCLWCRAPALGPHGLTHGHHSCRTRRGGHSVMEVTGKLKPERSHHSKDSGRCGLPISCWAIDLLIWCSRKLNPRRTLPDEK